MKRLVPALAAILILAGAAMAAKVYLEYKKGRDEYTGLAGKYTATGNGTEPGESLGGDEGDTEGYWIPEDAPARIYVDWGSLKNDNEDIIAWLQIPAIGLSYPVLQGEDNEYYLHRDPYGEYLYAGSIFVDYYNSPDFSNLNTVVYGHNMRDGSMFGKLKQFNDTEAFSSCPYFWIYTPEADLLYRIFSVHVASAGGSTYTVRFAAYEDYTSWLAKMRESSAIDTGAEASPGDTVVTLSTCSGTSDTRQTVQGYLAAKAPGLAPENQPETETETEP